jgi:D-arginine dehydrogenase
MDRYDFIVVGGGIAGASAGYQLAAHGKVLLLERESQLAYHSTGRSAALYLQTHGPAVIQALARGSKTFFTVPPEGFAEYPLVKPRGMLWIGRADQTDFLDHAAAEWMPFMKGVRRLNTREAQEIVPVLREDYIAGAVLEPEAMDLDVHAVHYGFIRGLRRRGGTIRTEADVRSLKRQGDTWTVESPAGKFASPVIINAAVAWCDKVAMLAGAKLVGLQPKRRTAFIFDPPNGVNVHAWPAVHDVGETFYFKPDAGKLLASPADETPVEPCDVQPDDLDVAIAVERVQGAARLPVVHINRKWAGLRSFVADGCPVVGFDPEVAGFFWLAGQGGYGIETSPSMGRLCASLAIGGGVPGDLADLGVTESVLSPARFAH